MVAPNFKCRRDLHDDIVVYGSSQCGGLLPLLSMFYFFFFLAFVRSRSRTNLEQVNWGAKCLDGE